MSSKTELRDSIHSGSISPSQMIHAFVARGDQIHPFESRENRRQLPSSLQKDYVRFYGVNFDQLLLGSATTSLALFVRTPSVHSRVSGSMWPNSCVLGMAFGFTVKRTISCPPFVKACRNIFQRTDFPLPEGPTITTPVRCCNCSYSSTAFFTYKFFFLKVTSLS